MTQQIQYQGILECFDTIISNPADFSASDNPNRLVLCRRVGPNDPPHKCTVGCEENMCKGTFGRPVFFPYPLSSPHNPSHTHARQVWNSSATLILIVNPTSNMTASSTSATAPTTFAPSCVSGGMPFPLHPEIHAHPHLLTAKTSSCVVASAASNIKSQTSVPKVLLPASSAPSSTGLARGKSRNGLKRMPSRRRWAPSIEHRRCWFGYIKRSPPQVYTRH